MLLSSDLPGLMNTDQWSILLQWSLHLSDGTMVIYRLAYGNPSRSGISISILSASEISFDSVKVTTK